MRSHSSRPRSSFLPPPGSQFLRFIGYLRRSAPKHCCCCARPRAQARICGCSVVSSTVSSVLTFLTTPSTTCALTTQRCPPQLCQQAAVTHSPSDAALAVAEGTLLAI